jgi:hypothetical protein
MKGEMVDHVISGTTTVRAATLCIATLCIAILCIATLCHCELPYCAILCHTVPYCVILCHTVPYCAILCHTVPYCALRWLGVSGWLGHRRRQAILDRPQVSNWGATQCV